MKAPKSQDLLLPLPEGPVPAGACANCGTPFAGNYCGACGQETKIETPTIRHFLEEMLDQYIAWEGKLGRTLRVLVTRPGQLTLDYIEGRRQRYVRPLKLYLSVSVAFFGIISVLPDSVNNRLVDLDRKEPAKAAQKSDGAPAAGQPQAARDAGNDGDDADADSAGAATAKEAGAAARSAADRARTEAIDAAAVKGKKVFADFGDKDAQNGFEKFLEAKGESFAKLPEAEQRRQIRDKVADQAPYTMFFLLPYFALLLRWLYRKNQMRYGAHLLFSLHLHCFAFMVMALGLLPLPSAVGTVLFWGVAAYLFLALRRVYGGTWKRTAWLTAVLGVIYMTTVGATILSTVVGTIFGSKA